MAVEQNPLADFTDPGSLGVLHLKRYREKVILRRSGKLQQDAFPEEWNIDITLLAVLGLGLEQTLKYLYNFNSSFKDFEDWVLGLNNGHLDLHKVETFNTYIRNRQSTYKKTAHSNNVLSQADMEHWNEHGYVIVRNAVPVADCKKSIDVICGFIDIDPEDPSTWYQPHPAKQGIMVQLFQHQLLEKNRLSERIRSACEQLWERKDLWVNTDRVGFNPPETETWKFPGPGLHWDVSLALPIPFGLQGILYLSDTAANQGAFTLVPGFQHKIEDWLNNLPTGTNARAEDMYALGAKPIVANAGDFIIWHQALPHGSSPNHAAQPRFVQYINYAPLDAAVQGTWI